MNKEFVLYFVVPVILGAVILLTGAILLFIDSRKKKKAGDEEPEGWETTGGKIISAELKKHEERREDTSGTHIDITYEPIIEYVYSVGGQEYRNNKVFAGSSIYLSQSAAQEILDLHPINVYVPVQYDPSNPAESSIEKRPEHTTYLYMTGMVLTAFGILVCCFTSFMAFIIIGGIR